MSGTGKAPGAKFQHLAIGGIAGSFMAALAQLLLPPRFLSDQNQFDDWRTVVAGPEYPGHAFVGTAKFYQWTLGWTGAPIELQAIVFSSFIGGLAAVVWCRADRRGRIVLLAGLPFMVAFLTPAGKDQILALCLAPLLLMESAKTRWLAWLPLLAFSAVVRPYWSLILLASMFGLPRAAGIKRHRWLLLCVAGSLLAFGVAFAVAGDGADWRIFAESKRDPMALSDYDTAFSQLPAHVDGFHRGVLNSAYAGWQMFAFRPVTGLFEVQQWGGYVGLALVAWAWATVERRGASDQLLVVGYPVLVALQLWFEPDFGSMVRHQTPLLLLVGTHSFAARRRRPVQAARSRPVFIGAIAIGALSFIHGPGGWYSFASSAIASAAAAVLIAEALRLSYRARPLPSRDLG